MAGKSKGESFNLLQIHDHCSMRDEAFQCLFCFATDHEMDYYQYTRCWGEFKGKIILISEKEFRKRAPPQMLVKEAAYILQKR